MPTVTLITTPDDLETAFTIRRRVFVEEQAVDAREEYDEFESSSRHFLARLDGQAVGTARWRRTTDGTKLERFAVLADARGRGAGKALVAAVLDDVARQFTDGQLIYLHAQISAMPLYAGFGFAPVGERFWEAGIEHVKMVLPGA